jgi:hypothetical protein
MSAPNYIPMLHISPETQRLLKSVSFKWGSYSAGPVRKSWSEPLDTNNTYTHDNVNQMQDITNSSHSNHHHVTSYALIDLLQPPIIVSYKGPESHLCPFGLYFKLTFSILLLFIPVTCSSQSDMYFLSFLSASSTFNSTKISSFLLWSNLVNSLFFWKISSYLMSIFFFILFEGPNFTSK